jgi:hypothetical protein
MSELIQNPNLSPASPADVLGLPPSDIETSKKARGGRAPKPKSSGNRTISALTKGLTEDEKAVVDRLLKEIPDSLKDYANRSSELGKSLYELQQVFATAGRKGRFSRSLAELKVPKSTAYDLIACYTTIKDLPAVILQAAEEAGIDLGSPKLRSRVEDLSISRADLDLASARTIIEPLTKKTKREVRPRFGPGITDDEKIVYVVYDALRRSTGDLSDHKKKEAVAKALNWYAHYVLKYEQPAKMELTPTKAADDWVLNPSKGKTAELEVAA